MLYTTWQSSYGSTWSNWASLGSPGGGVTLVGQPVVVTNPDGSLSAYALGSDHNLKTTWQFGYGTNWHSWVSLGSPSGNLTGTPVITQDSRNGSAQSAFMIGSGALWTSWQSSYGSTWSTWVSLGGINLSVQPVVVTNPDGSLSAYARGTDGQLWTVWQFGYGTNWHSPVALGSSGGGFTSNPVITQDSLNGGAQNAFMVGSDGALWTSWQSSYGGTWSGWTSLGP